MRIRFATWNINSVRLRASLVTKLLIEADLDVLVLQETKSPVEKIPHDVFAALGYRSMVARGEKGYNGVAILARHPLEDVGSIDFCAKGDARHVSARLTVDGAAPVTIHNLYVPAGGDIPDRDLNNKFDHKLRFVDEIGDRFDRASDRSIVAGDLNIAPLEHDVWSHKQLLTVVSHTPVEVEKFEDARRIGGWIDAARTVVPADQKLYSWWSYRARDWADSDRGRRLDHIWLSPDMAESLGGCVTLKEARGWEKPSDHAPVIAVLDL